jgi:membrane associated rhomboid family serine protease
VTAKYELVAFIATVTAIVLVVGLGIVALAYGLNNPAAFVILSSAITGLVATASRFTFDVRTGA